MQDETSSIRIHFRAGAKHTVQAKSAQMVWTYARTAATLLAAECCSCCAASRKMKGTGNPGKPGKKLRLEDLQSQFGVGLKEAANRLGICPTTLKVRTACSHALDLCIPAADSVRMHA